jgi:hypothetical protein
MMAEVVVCAANAIDGRGRLGRIDLHWYSGTAPCLAASINVVDIGASTTAGKRVGVEGAYPA